MEKSEPDLYISQWINSQNNYIIWGEMCAEELYETTMNPANRHLVQLTTEDMETTMKLYGDLMGKQPSLRRDFIMKNKLSSIKGDDDLYEDFADDE